MEIRNNIRAAWFFGTFCVFLHETRINFLNRTEAKNCADQTAKEVINAPLTPYFEKKCTNGMIGMQFIRIFHCRFSTILTSSNFIFFNVLHQMSPKPTPPPSSAYPGVFYTHINVGYRKFQATHGKERIFNFRSETIAVSGYNSFPDRLH